VAAVNRIGEDGKGHAYSGDSQVLDFQGETLMSAGAQAGIFRTTLSLEALAIYRERFPAHLDADRFSFE
jgi:predicted amidohydrolase